MASFLIALGYVLVLLAGLVIGSIIERRHLLRHFPQGTDKHSFILYQDAAGELTATPCACGSCHITFTGSPC